ncbi:MULTISPECIES: tape measure protein [Leuconostoc]|uniref:Minor tail protein n=2 Tax=Leuconostoc TaxID=1243 RepID=A0ABM9V3W8_9LACO|nr:MULTISPECIES: tape measure protein [Leuconostoc]CUW12228.1 putative minor tail protein [Leuconostoc inhae]
MATIGATLQIYDRFSSPLKDYASGLKSAAQASSGLKGAIANAVNGMSFQKPKSELDQLGNQVEKTGGLFKTMLGANIIGAGIVKGIGAISNGVKGLIGDLSSSSATWQTFQGNMEQLGKSKSDISSAKKSMQDFATQTIYSGSDMASTYAQLAAVGTKNTGELVKGFGGLAAASEDPAQAMKTLSQQATQMAAKPKVAWEDFKLMLEQSPAGMAAVAKTMNMSTGDLIKNIQGGKVATQDFFNTIQKTGTNANFTKMATQFKTVGQAVDGLKETLTNALQPAFDKVSKIGISAVSGLTDMIGEINFSSLADKIIGFFSNVGKQAANFWTAFKSTGAVIAVIDAFFSIRGAIDSVMSALKSTDGKSLFTIKNAAEAVGNAVIWVANQIDDFAMMIQRMDPSILEAVAVAAKIALTAFLGWKAITGVIGGVSGAIKGLSGAFTGVGSAMGFMAKHPILSTIIALAAAFAYAYMNSEKFRNGVNTVVSAIGKAVGVIADFVVKNKELVGALSVPAIAGFGFLIAGLSGKFSKLLGPLSKVSGLFNGFGKAKASGAGKVAEDITKVTDAGSSFKSIIGKGLNFTIKAIGIAIVIASLALLAKSLEGIANAGAQAPENLATFGVVVAGLAGTFALFGGRLQSSAVGIAVFAGSMSILALALAPIANAGAGAATNMAVFGVVVGGLAIVFAVFGTALTAAIPAMLIFGVTMLLIGVAALLVGSGIMLATMGMALLATQLPMIAAYGTSAAVGLLALGAAAIVFGVGALIAGIGLVILGAGLLVVGVGATIAAVGMLLLGAATMVFGIGLLIVSAAIMIVATGFMLIASVIPTVAAGFMLLVVPAMLLMAVLPIIGVTLLLVGAAGIIAGVGLLLAGTGALVAGAGMLVLAAGIAAVGIALVVLAAGIMALYTTIASIFSQIVSAVSSAMNNVVSAVSNGIQSAISAVKNVAGSLVSAGRDFVMGFVNGIKGAVGAAADAASSMAKSAMSAAKKFLGIHSPSRLMRDEVGYYVGAGMAVGINNSASLVSDSAVNMAQDAFASASNISAPTLNTPTMATMNIGDVMANGFMRAANALDILIGKLIGMDGVDANVTGSTNVTQAKSAFTSDTGMTRSSTNNSSQTVNFNFGDGSIVVQTNGSESGEELLEKIAAAAKKYSDKGLAF